VRVSWGVRGHVWGVLEDAFGARSRARLRVRFGRISGAFRVSLRARLRAYRGHVGGAFEGKSGRDGVAFEGAFEGTLRVR
jgi:hypothetical protein